MLQKIILTKQSAFKEIIFFFVVDMVYFFIDGMQPIKAQEFSIPKEY